MTGPEAILSAAKAALTGVTGVQDSAVYRSRAVALMREEVPALILEPVSASGQRGATNRQDWELNFQVSIIVRDNTADTASSAIAESVVDKIMNDSALNAFVVDLLPSAIDWEFASADVPLTVQRITFIAKYSTAALAI